MQTPSPYTMKCSLGRGVGNSGRSSGPSEGVRGPREQASMLETKDERVRPEDIANTRKRAALGGAGGSRRASGPRKSSGRSPDRHMQSEDERRLVPTHSGRDLSTCPKKGRHVGRQVKASRRMVEVDDPGGSRASEGGRDGINR